MQAAENNARIMKTRTAAKQKSNTGIENSKATKRRAQDSPSTLYGLLAREEKIK